MHNSGELYSLCTLGLLSVNEINFVKVGSVHSRGGEAKPWQLLWNSC